MDGIAYVLRAALTCGRGNLAIAHMDAKANISHHRHLLLVPFGYGLSLASSHLPPS
jgi:hypothetical protein